MDYSSKWIRVAVPQSVAGAVREGPWRLDQYANTTAHERYAAAAAAPLLLLLHHCTHIGMLTRGFCCCECYQGVITCHAAAALYLLHTHWYADKGVLLL